MLIDSFQHLVSGEKNSRVYDLLIYFGFLWRFGREPCASDRESCIAKLQLQWFFSE